MTSIREKYNILLKELCYDFLRVIDTDYDNNTLKDNLRIKCKAILWKPQGKNMDNVEILWFNDSENNIMHAAFSKKAFTLCSKNIGKEMKFKNLYDYANFQKCDKCSKMINNIYKGIM